MKKPTVDEWLSAGVSVLDDLRAQESELVYALENVRSEIKRISPAVERKSTQPRDGTIAHVILDYLDFTMADDGASRQSIRAHVESQGFLPGSADAMLLKMLQRGQIRRTGQRGQYRFHRSENS